MVADINEWRSIENTPRSMRSTRRVSSGLTSGHVQSRSSKLAINKRQQSVPMLSYDSDELRFQSCGSTREELPQPERGTVYVVLLALVNGQRVIKMHGTPCTRQIIILLKFLET